MRFEVLPVRGRPPSAARSCAFLVTDNWDDYTFKTMYYLVFVDEDGARHRIGSVKIGRFGMSEPDRITIPDQFERLDDLFFSLGQDDSYYTNLNDQGEAVRDSVLAALNDLAVDEDRFARALREKVTGVSLLRSVTPATVQGQFARLARGGARLSGFDFSYRPPPFKRSSLSPSLEFVVQPESEPPTNIHVIIGRNGVGKTHLLQMMGVALTSNANAVSNVGEFSTPDEDAPADAFANLVTVSFSAFDEFEHLRVRQNKANALQHSYIGLKRTRSPDGKPTSPKSPSQLSAEFVKSVRLCKQGPRSSRWLRALKMLEADPIFADAEIADLAERDPDPAEDPALAETSAASLFANLSSGHKIVLLTITRLVETVEERSLLLVDEPEAHLHPPLLSAFIRALSDLLVNRNGVAIIATHSPVVLQEVPASCVWKMRRVGGAVAVERPEIETFGENVGVLTREVFGLEVTQSGFHRLVWDAVEEGNSFEDVVERFGGHLGAEAMAIARALVAARDRSL
ncbi:MAG: AAA family ATPase [Actinomycetota bacterium]|nr:AAA family ATPase [Actinomycetota bacterium]